MRIDDWSSDVCSADLRERGKPMAGSYGEWLQLWPYAILMIVIASWLLYHFLAHASWQDWTGAGLVQAFIIALYAEMYGFQLTIYFKSEEKTSEPQSLMRISYAVFCLKKTLNILT